MLTLKLWRPRQEASERWKIAKSSSDIVFVVLAGDGTVEASGGQTAAWWLSFARHQQIRFDQVGDLTISTIFLGIADRLSNGNLVAAFETIIFGADGLPQESWRWSTLQEARVGHAWALGG